MEEFLEVILQVEREATQLQDEARDHRVSIEKRHVRGLRALEERALAALREELEAAEQAAESQGVAEGELITQEGRKTIEKLERQALDRREQALAHVVTRLLARGGEGGV